jgi:hypothetical protein
MVSVFFDRRIRTSATPHGRGGVRARPSNGRAYRDALMGGAGYRSASCPRHSIQADHPRSLTIASGIT